MLPLMLFRSWRRLLRPAASVDDAESAWIADGAKAFARACAEALAEPAEAERRAEAARELLPSTTTAT